MNPLTRLAAAVVLAAGMGASMATDVPFVEPTPIYLPADPGVPHKTTYRRPAGARRNPHKAPRKYPMGTRP